MLKFSDTLSLFGILYENCQKLVIISLSEGKAFFFVWYLSMWKIISDTG